MKLSDVVIGGTVYFKKSSITFADSSIPHIVERVEKRKWLHDLVVFEDYKVNAGELTDIPCSQMTCENCKYHPREVKDEKADQ